MLHARIAARAFNTPLLVDPTKAMAFMSGLGPRILGRRVELTDGLRCQTVRSSHPRAPAFWLETLPRTYSIMMKRPSQSWTASR